MTIRRLAALPVATVLALLVTSTPAWPDACIDEASEAARECRAVCKESYQLAKDTCSNRDHVCVEGCRTARETCRQPHEETLDGLFADCSTALSAAKTTCRGLHADGSSELDACIDDAQVIAFQCRDLAREQVGPALKVCRKDFKVCVSTNCPPSSEPDPAARRACKDDAKALFADCLADCQEAKQLAKDTCLDRDHLCVEGCRAQRDTCWQPFEDQRAALIAACNTARGAAFDICRMNTVGGTPERDTCIDAAQVQAFVCRDMAREQTRSPLNSCRLAFQECAEGCPPPGQSTTTTDTSTTTSTTAPSVP